MATEFGWVGSVDKDVHYYPNVKLDKVVTITAKDATPQTSTTWNGVYYENATDATKSDWRMYQARNGGEFNFSVAVGYQLKSITLTYSNKYTGVVALVQGSSVATDKQVKSGTKLSLNPRTFSKTLYVSNSSTPTNGQARITKFSVEYESVPVDTLYLNTGGSGLWNQAGAKFSVWYWNDGEQGHFTDFLELAIGETDIYRAIIPKSDSVIFVRHDAAADVPTWENKWNQTKSDEVDLEIGNIMVITGWEPADREWDYYTPKEPEPIKIYAKNNWDGGDWTWLEMQNDSLTFYSLDSVVFGGTGININSKADDNDKLWFGIADIERTDTLIAGDTIQLVFNLADSTLAAEVLGRPYVPEYTYDTLYTIAGNFTNWATDMQEMPYEVENVAKDSVLEYKVVRQLITYVDGEESKRDTTWLGQPNENQMTRESNAWKLDGGNNVKLTADADGTYKFEFTPADSVLTVTFPALLPQLDSVNTIANIKACYEAGTLKDNDTIRVKGYIASMFLKPTNFAKYGSVTIWMTDTLGGKAKEFELYNCYGLEKDTFAYFGPGYNTTGTKNIDVDTIIGRNNVRFVVGDYIEAVGAFKNYSGTFELVQGCNIYEGGEKMVRYAKNRWENEDPNNWTWKEMTYVVTKNQYELTNVVYGGVGLNVNTQPADQGALWIPEASFLGDKVQAKDTVSFVFNPSDNTLTATLIARPAPEPKVYYITGNKALVGETLEWNPKAIAMKDSVHTFMAIAAGDYKMKVTDGTWANAWGYANLSEASSEGISGDADGNICFTVETANNVVVSIANGVVTVTGNFKKEPTSVQDVLMKNEQMNKVVVNGQLYIIRNGVMYNATGARVK